MRKNKLILVLSVVTILAMGISTAAFAAADYNTPAEITAGLTGKTVDEVTADRQEGTSYGAQAEDAGKLDEFQAERLAVYEQNLAEAVLDGRLTQAEADKLLEEMTLRMEACDGTGTGDGQQERNGAGNGLCDGSGAGQDSDGDYGYGMGMGMGRGTRAETGSGNGSGTGSESGCGACMNQST